ncbi:putative accessory processing protein [Candidatus Burkholderia verschuerenii]|uniref:Putative accessory processing protein n=2 Tax=Candidatus Burkholderia verschuerenii TaxID=242163 RepID=A0A0L0M947_9BURK|nr:putative accessory processing protein [Candidatus Burkholderia verschuerenii]
MLGDPRFTLTDVRWHRLLPLRPLIRNVLAIDPSQSADRVLEKWLTLGEPASSAPPDVARRIAFLYHPTSRTTLNFALLWQMDRPAAASLGLASCGTSYSGSPATNARRIALLEWLPSVLNDVPGILEVDLEGLLMSYMYCSYAPTDRRHDIKRNVNTLVRRKLANLGFGDPR